MIDSTVVKYGFVSVQSHPRESRIARVTINGIDVTRDCTAADDVQGWAECFIRDEDGRLIREPTCLRHERLTGDVVIDFPKGLD